MARTEAKQSWVNLKPLPRIWFPSNPNCTKTWNLYLEKKSVLVIKWNSSQLPTNMQSWGNSTIENGIVFITHLLEFWLRCKPAAERPRWHPDLSVCSAEGIPLETALGVNHQSRFMSHRGKDFYMALLSDFILITFSTILQRILLSRYGIHQRMNIYFYGENN